MHILNSQFYDVQCAKIWLCFSFKIRFLLYLFTISTNTEKAWKPITLCGLLHNVDGDDAHKFIL